MNEAITPEHIGRPRIRGRLFFKVYPWAARHTAAYFIRINFFKKINAAPAHFENLPVPHEILALFIFALYSAYFDAIEWRLP